MVNWVRIMIELRGVLDGFCDKGFGFIDCLIEGFFFGQFSSNYCSKGIFSIMCMIGLNLWIFLDKLVFFGKEEIFGIVFEMVFFDDNRLRIKFF